MNDAPHICRNPACGDYKQSAYVLCADCLERAAISAGIMDELAILASFMYKQGYEAAMREVNGVVKQTNHATITQVTLCNN